MPAKLIFQDGKGGLDAVPLSEQGTLLCTTEAGRLVPRARLLPMCYPAAASPGWRVLDVDATGQGLFVNDQRVQEATLRHDDLLRCGGLTLRYRESPEIPPLPPSYDALRDECEALRGERARLKEELDQRRGQVVGLEEQRRKDEAALAALHGELRQTSAELVERRKEAQEANARAAAAARDLTAALAEARRKEERARELEEALARTEAQKQAREQEIAALRRDKSQLEEGMRQQAGEIHNLRTVVDRLQGAHEVDRPI